MLTEAAEAFQSHAPPYYYSSLAHHHLLTEQRQLITKKEIMMRMKTQDIRGKRKGQPNPGMVLLVKRRLE